MDQRWGWIAAVFISASAVVYGQDRVQEPLRYTDAAALDVVRGQARELNVYDSLGEAYAVHGDRELAIRNYERSIELNPRNTGGIEALSKLREKK